MPATAKIKIFGTAGSAPAYAIRDYLQRGDVPFEWIELRDEEQARARAHVTGLDDRRLPVCAFADGTRLECPSLEQITAKLGWLKNPSHAEYDLAIYGAGPAGLSAAVYGASEGLKTVVIEAAAVGGQASTSSRIENYLGFPHGISGAELAARAREQADRFGAEILLLRAGVRAELEPGRGIGYLDDGTQIVARATLCATGVQYRRLGLANEERLLGAGVYYGAGASEAMLCGGEHVFIVGGGNSAGQAAMHFAHYARRVSMMIRGEGLKATLSDYLIHRIRNTANIEVVPHTEVVALDGGERLQTITLADRRDGARRTVPARALFLCLGGVPQTQWAADLGIARDEAGYLLTGPDLRGALAPWPLERAPYFLETSAPGQFAAGDVRHGSVKRCASAVGEGAMAVAFIHRYLAQS